jgi:hypothetical protein
MSATLNTSMSPCLFGALGLVAAVAVGATCGVYFSRRRREGRLAWSREVITEEANPDTILESRGDVLTLSLVTPSGEFGSQRERARKSPFNQSSELWDSSVDCFQADGGA